MIFIDTHAHLDMMKKSTPQEAVDLAAKCGVKYIINVGSSIEASKKAEKISKTFQNIYATAGIHPHYATEFGPQQKKTLLSCIEGNSKLVAIGETGFDFYRNLSPKEEQKKAFESQIEIALEHGLPLIVHDREAHQETLEVLKKYHKQKQFKAVMHCFSGDRAFAEEVLKLGMFISFTGVITFPNAGRTVEAAKAVPIEKIFLETDAPFLAPQAKRGRENQPAYCTYIAEKLASVKGLRVEEVAEKTTKNALDFFGI